MKMNQRFIGTAGAFCIGTSLLLCACDRDRPVPEAGVATDATRIDATNHTVETERTKLAKETEEAAESARRAARETGEAIKEGAKEAAQEIGKGLERAGEELQK